MSKEAEPELDLLDRWCAGETHAGNELLRRIFPALYRYFFNKVGTDTDDLVQETMLACVRKRDRIRELGRFRPYLFRVARSVLYDHLRQLCRNREEPVSQLSVEEVVTSRVSLLDRQRAVSAIRLALRRLPLELQEVLELHYWEGMATAEIAEVLEVAQGTVKSRLRRARERLESILPPGSSVERGMADVRPEPAPAV